MSTRGIEFARPTDSDIAFIAETMREQDVAEVWASDRQTPLESLNTGVQLSHYSVVTRCDDIPLVIFGLVVQDVLTGKGVPWMLSSTHALDRKRIFLQYSPSIVKEMAQLCPHLYNYVHVDNTVSIRWLRWLGFTISDPEPRGRGGELFHPFFMRNESCAVHN